MKITNWTKKLSGALLAVGIWVPSAAFAANIPLADAGFDDFPVAAGSYAYAQPSFTPEGYRPPVFPVGVGPSAWVDDPDLGGQDDTNSNWLYETGYDSTRRPAPRSGNQAMHGSSNYSGQETGAVFLEGETYTFSVWAQGDSDSTDSSSRVWMYIYDGSIPFTEPASLNFARYAPDTGDFINRTAGNTQAESQLEWTKISISYRVPLGAPEIGNPVGVAFWAASDAGVEDATLTVTPEPSTVILVGLGGVMLLAARRRMK